MHPAYIVRIGDARELYDLAWRQSCGRIAEKLREAEFILIREETPLEAYVASMELTSFDNPQISLRRRSDAVKELDYLAYGDFNKFFRIVIDISMEEQLYLAECRESYCSVPVEIEVPKCCCAIL